MEWIVNTAYYVVPFIILLGILVFVHELGHFLVARSMGVSVSAFSIGFGKELWSKTDKHGTVWKISAVPLGGYCQFLGDADESSSTSEVNLDEYSEEEQKHLFATQNPFKKLLISIAGPFFNYLFAFILFFCLFFFIGVYEIPPVVSEVLENSPAEKVGIMKDDIILEINGHEIKEWSDIGAEVSLTIDTAQIKIKRNDDILTFDVPLETIEYAFDETEEPIKRRMLGVKGESKLFKKENENFKFKESFYRTGKKIYEISSMTLRGVYQMLTGARSSEDVGGIIRIAEMSGDISKKRGLLDFLSFMALLSINLGLINLFPIPLLDGGHVIIYLLELVSGRQLNTKVRDFLFKIGLCFILFLMVFATWNDVRHLITRWFE